MKQSLQLRLSQSLTMTPQLQQAIRLLQLSSLELQTEIQDALESNMMLELAEDSVEPAETDKQTTDRIQKDTEQDLLDVKDRLDKNEIPEELPVDSAWDDIYDSNPVYAKQQTSEYIVAENQDNHKKTLSEHLLWQLNLTPTSDLDTAIAFAIIDDLDDDRYLTSSTTYILAAFGNGMQVEVDEIEAVLNLVQAMEPAGVAARDLQECLALQLAQCSPDTPWLPEAKELVNKHLQLLANHDYNQLMRRMKLAHEQLQEVVVLIQSMHPRPGSLVQDSHVEYITPDVYVKKEKGVWKVDLNIDTLPRLRINSSYAGMIRRADNSADNTSLNSHLQ